MLNQSKVIKTAPQNYSERKIQTAYCNAYGGTTEMPSNMGRIDLLTNTCIYEIKDYKYFKAALGQILCYAEDYISHKRIIVLFNVPKDATPTLKHFIDICALYGVFVECIYLDTKLQLGEVYSEDKDILADPSLITTQQQDKRRRKQRERLKAKATAIERSKELVYQKTIINKCFKKDKDCFVSVKDIKSHMKKYLKVPITAAKVVRYFNLTVSNIRIKGKQTSVIHGLKLIHPVHSVN